MKARNAFRNSSEKSEKMKSLGTLPVDEILKWI
jgi:hypothetical protein